MTTPQKPSYALDGGRRVPSVKEQRGEHIPQPNNIVEVVPISNGNVEGRIAPEDKADAKKSIT